MPVYIFYYSKMASLLRSSKFIKFFTGITRNLAINSIRNDALTLSHNGSLMNSAVRYLATQSNVARVPSESNLERSLRRLDMDARRAGRISMKELEDVLEELKHTKSATSSQSLLVIRCCGNLVPEEQPEIRTKLVSEIWKTIESLAEFLKELEVKGIEPNRVTFQRLITRYCQKGDIEGATQILQFMKEKQMPVNENVFNALVMGHSQSGDMESARGVLGLMEQAGLQPSAETYATLMCGYAKAGDIEGIKNVMKECDLKDKELLDRDLMDVIYVSVSNGHHELTEELLNRMRRVGGYNQDAINLILKLVNNGYEDIGYKVLQTMPRPIRTDGEQMPTGAFFIRQLVKAKRPIEKILYYCNELQKNDLNPKAHLIALEACLTLTKLPEQAFAIMDELNKNGMPPRTHFFWPLLVSSGKNGDVDGMIAVIKKMFEVKVVPGVETLKDYVVPHLAKEVSPGGRIDPESVIANLRGAGISSASAANAVVAHLVAGHKLKEAAELAQKYQARYSALSLQKPMTMALINSGDMESYINILSLIYAGTHRTRFSPAAEAEEVEESVKDAEEGNDVVNVDVGRRIVGGFVGLLSKGLGISSSHAEIVQDRLGSDLTPEISSVLTKLTADDLTPSIKPMENVLWPPALEGKALENLLEAQEARGNPTRGIKKQLLTYYCRSKDLEGATRIVEKLKAETDFVYTDGMNALLMELYAAHNKLDEALEYKKKVTDKGALVEDFKVLKLVDALLKADRFEEAMKVISEQNADRKLEPRSFVYNAFCWRLLNSVAEAGKVEEVEKLFEALVKNNFIEPTNVLMGPLIKVHLEKNDIESAMKKFEWCCETYGATPNKNQLSCKLIEIEDAVSLQKVTDLSTRIHGEVNSLYDLVFAFIECGRVRQARKILETPGLRNRPQRMNMACRRYSEEGMVAPLEHLVEATKDLSHIDRSEIYQHLLMTYCKTNDADKALGLWTQMQDEDVQPTDEFLISLAGLLRKNNKEVPFVVPTPVASLSVSGNAITPQKEQVQQKADSSANVATTPLLQRFRQAIRIGDIDAALQCKARFEAEGKRMSVTEVSLLVEQLVKNDRIGEATAIVETYLSPEVRQGDKLINPRVLRYLLNRLANLGDIDSFSNLGSFLSMEEKRLLSFDNRLCSAYIISGKSEQYLKDLEKKITSAKDEDLDNIQDSFPRGGALGILKNNPELIPMYESIALKYAAHNITSPINVLWQHCFSEGKEAEADAIWKKYLSNNPRLMFQFVCQTARTNKDIGLIQKLLQTIKETPITDSARGNANSCLIDIYVADHKTDEALNALKEALKVISLENIPRGCLLRLKKAVEAEGKSFPYTIPEKNVRLSSSSSDSSSSDDERAVKKA
ncbi:hypothetical protein J437_LFUL006294 [Ladona fulva]|uniref:PROP1-like PPR domain-containing protein n=1 Tax=Ladona fulva TaxID=123851 RepID=A0A8K0K1U1_LADFU|nr:hypothetical protein J437_LFUL006294 [Ladona fulva]